MSDEHPSDDDENWFAKERRHTEFDRRRSRTAQTFAVINGGLAEEDHAQYLALVARREEQRKRDAESNAAQVERVRGLVQRIKASSEPRKQVELVNQLKAAGHPDVDGLLQALENRTPAGNRARRDKGL